MLPKPRNYSVYPSVVKADTEVELTVVPNENAFAFFENETIKITVASVNGDEDWYHDPHSHKYLSAVARDGVLRFKYTFPEEMEHLILLSRDGAKPFCELYVYSLYDDLYNLRPLKGDFHVHSYRSDGARDPAAMAGHFREQGYEFFAMTDHNRYYPGEEIDKAFGCTDVDFTRVFGEEVHAPNSPLHIIHVGGKASVAELYCADLEKYEAEVELCRPKVPENIPEVYKDRYARMIWVVDKIHEFGGLAIFVHPYWKPGKSKVYHMRDELASIFLNSGMFDAYELVGGMGQVGVNRSIALWGDLRAQGLKLSVVGSSDVHKIENADTFPHYFTVCFADASENDAIIAAVKAGQSVAVEATGNGYKREYRCYGSLRYVSYAQFLLKEFYPELQRVCAAEGVTMRALARGEDVSELLRLQGRESEKYRMRFFGKAEPYLPTKEILAYVDERREIQKQGPDGKGSLLGTKNMQI